MQFEEQIKACIQAEASAQRDLFYQHAPLLMGVAMRYVKEEEAAQDVVQESFIRIFNSLSTLRQFDKATVLSWMKKITARESLRWLKKNERYYSDHAEDVLQRIEVAPATGLYEKDLLNLLNRLSSGYRAVFNLYVIEGFSHQEIGEMLNISTSTSRSQLTRAKKQLKEWIKYNNEYVVK